MKFFSVPAVVGGHDCFYIIFDSLDIPRKVNGSQLCFRDDRIALVIAVLRTSIADIMFGTCDNAGGRIQGVILEASDGRRPKQLSQLRGFTKAFIGATPAFIPGYSNTGCEGPVDTCCGYFNSCYPADLFHEYRISRGSQPNIMREDHSTGHVAMAVDRIDTIDQRNLKSCLKRLVLKGIVEICPMNCVITSGGV